MRSATRSALTVVVLVLAGLTGCVSSGDEVAAPSSASTTASTPMSPPESVVSPSVDARPAADTLVLSTAGLGPLTIGLAPEMNPGAAMIVFHPNECADQSDPTGRGPGRWVANYPPFVDAEGNEHPQFWVDANETDGVYWIDVIDPEIQTTTGIRVGSTLADLQAAYPELVAGTPGPTSQPWWVSEPAGTLNFEVSDGQSPGTAPGVVIIHVQGPGTNPDWTSANTDLVAGGCL